MATLYEIDAQIADTIMRFVDPETGELYQEAELLQQLDELNADRTKKVEDIALFYKNSLSDAAAYKAEKEHFAKRQKSAERTAESMKFLLEYALKGEKFKTSRVQVSYRPSARLVVDDENAVPEEYRKYSFTVDKTAAKKAINDGVEVAGCRIEKVNNIQIK